MPINRLFTQHSCGCSCDTILSFGERVIYNLLKELNISFIHEATASNVFPWAKRYRYDFYIPSKNMILEIHGAQHYVEHGFGESMDGKTLEEEQENDRKKQALALANGIDKYIVIDCRKSTLKWLLNSIREMDLESIFDFNIDDIDENVLLRQSYRTFQKQVLEVLEPGITLDEISEKTHISVYMLKKMMKLGLFSLKGVRSLLRVWLPLTKDLRQQGLANTSTITLASGNAFVDGGKVGNKALHLTKQQTILGTSSCMSGKKQMSYAFWVKVNTAWSAQWLDGIAWYSTDGSSAAYSRQEFYTNCTRIGTWFSGSSLSGYVFTPGEWTHIAGTFDYTAGIAKFYINGVLQGTSTSLSKTHYCRGDFYIGDNGVDIVENDVRIYDHCLSEGEVKRLAQGLILHYPLNRNGLGQENLLLNTQVLTPNSSTSTKNCSQRGSSTRQLRSDGFYEAKCTAAWQGLSTWANAQNLVVGQKYTYSFYFYTNGSTKSLSFYPMMYNSGGTRDTSSTLPISVDGSTYQNGNARGFGAFSNTIPVRHYVTFEWNNTMASIINNGGTIELSIQVHGTFNNGEYGCVYAPKLEIGDKMTSWCPNVADANNMGLDSTIEYDCSGFGNNGTRTGTFTWTSDTPKYNVSTHIGTTSSKIHISNFPTSGFGNSYSFAWWGKRSSNTPMFWGFSDGIRLNGMYIGTLWNTGDGSNNPLYNIGTTTQVTAPSTNTWHHYVMTGNGTKCYVYLDGELWGEAKTYKAISGTSIYINGWDSGTQYCSDNTDISDFRIYATALSASDVKSLYQNCATIDPDGTIRGQIRS